GQADVFSRGPGHAQRIDVTDPASPIIAAGGPKQNPTFGIRLDETQSEAMLLPESDPDVLSLYTLTDRNLIAVASTLGHANSTAIQRVTYDNEHELGGDSFQLPGGNASLQVAGDFIYRSAISGDSVRFQRWLLDDLRAGITTPSMDLSLSAPANANL